MPFCQNLHLPATIRKAILSTTSLAHNTAQRHSAATTPSLVDTMPLHRHSLAASELHLSPHAAQQSNIFFLSTHHPTDFKS